MEATIDISILDPVFAKFGVEMYTAEYIDMLRDENLNSEDPISYNIIPQAGFQEKVLTCEADVIIIGGKRGGGKSFIMELAPMRYIDNPLFSSYGFRKEEDDIKRGLWNTSKKIYTSIAREMIESSFIWRFFSGAFVKYEHLANESNIDRRFRGVEIPSMIIDELLQITAQTFFTLLASNRNSLGIPNQFIASCNPAGEKHWVHKFIKWYIDPETKTIIPERDGKIRYFYKWGKDITEIAYGDSKEEVYQKVKPYIDDIWDERLEEQGRNRLDLINSLCFIEGSYSENKLFIKIDPQYLGNLAQQGGEQSRKDLKGIWQDTDEGTSELDIDDFQNMLNNTIEQRDGNRYAVMDVGLTNDEFVIGAFDGSHLYDMEAYKGVGSMTVLALVKNFLDKNHIHIKNTLFDSDGVGNYLQEPLKTGKGGAYAYNNNSSSTDRYIWYNYKSECADKFKMAVKELRFSIDQKLLNRKFGKMTLREHLEEERNAFRYKDTNNGKIQLIPKKEMKVIMGQRRSTNFLDVCFMQQHFVIKKVKRGVKGLGLLGN